MQSRNARGQFTSEEREIKELDEDREYHIPTLNQKINEIVSLVNKYEGRFHFLYKSIEEQWGHNYDVREKLESQGEFILAIFDRLEKLEHPPYPAYIVTSKGDNFVWKGADKPKKETAAEELERKVKGLKYTNFDPAEPNPLCGSTDSKAPSGLVLNTQPEPKDNFLTYCTSSGDLYKLYTDGTYEKVATTQPEPKECKHELRKCPRCKEGINSGDLDGNPKCFHCSKCNYVECEET